MTITQQGRHYRPEIDGLRAIAVLAVVAYHVSPKLLPGGFTGVDIFFVISGYLITRIILEDQAQGQFTFAQFYSKRVRRLFPSLVTVLAASWFLGLLTLLSSELSSLGKEMAFAAGFLSNVQFAMQQSYFDVAAATKPLLHLWSLGVEEQFYLFWPVLLVSIITYRIRKRLLFYVGTASFAINLAVVAIFPAFAFYLPFTRLWEFLLGAAVSILPFRFLRSRNESAFIGFIFIFFAFGLVRETFLFPGTWALLPTIGTVLILTTKSEAPITKLLSLRTLRYIGLISYPLYLWHWPILVFLRVLHGYEPPIVWKILGATGAFVLASLTYRFVEIPLRFYQISAEKERRKTYALLAALAGIGILGIVTVLAEGFPSRISGVPSAIHDGDSHRNNLIDDDCPILQFAHKGTFWCRLDTTTAPPNRALIGDSHAQALFPSLIRYSESKEHWLTIAGPGCIPFFKKRGEQANSECEIFFKEGLEAVGKNPEIDWVLFAFHFHVATEPYVVERARATFEFLRKHGKRMAILIDNPIASMLPERCGRFRPIERMGIHLGSECSISRKQHEENLRELRLLAKALWNDDPNLVIFDPTDMLCDSENCPVLKNGRSLYSYNHHLSDFGTEQFAPALLSRMRAARELRKNQTPSAPHELGK